MAISEVIGAMMVLITEETTRNIQEEIEWTDHQKEDATTTSLTVGAMMSSLPEVTLTGSRTEDVMMMVSLAKVAHALLPQVAEVSTVVTTTAAHRAVLRERSPRAVAVAHSVAAARSTAPLVAVARSAVAHVVAAVMVQEVSSEDADKDKDKCNI